MLIVNTGAKVYVQVYLSGYHTIRSGMADF